MQTTNDLQSDYQALGRKLRSVIDALDDPEARASGSDAAALARARRALGSEASDDHAADLESDYELLGEALRMATGAGAAAVANERRMIRELLTVLRQPKVVPLVDQLAERRQSRTKPGGAAARRRKSG